MSQHQGRIAASAAPFLHPERGGAIEATGALVLPATSVQALRLQGGMALLRLVNALIDPLQQKQYAVSVRGLAQQIDLPAILVELRHDSTHGELPTLPVLEKAAYQVCWPRLANLLAPWLS